LEPIETPKPDLLKADNPELAILSLASNGIMLGIYIWIKLHIENAWSKR
jgi:hypothetical protein